MKILILANNDVGLFRFRRELIRQLLEKHTVLIALPYGDAVEQLKEDGCRFIDLPVDRRGIDPIKDGLLFLRCVRLLLREKPDLVITYTVKPNIYGGIACRMLRIPYAVNITGLGTAFQREGMLKKLVCALYRCALKKAKRIFFENSENRAVFLQLKLAQKEQSMLLDGAGVDLPYFSYTDYPAGDTPLRFLFIGRIMKEKGVDELFAAMRRLHREGEVCTLDVLGGCEENYAQSLKEGEDEGWLHYHGFQQDVRPFIAASHCFVLPSYHEGMANTNLECAAMGRPLITSDIPGCREAVIPKESGMLIKPQDENSLYETMKAFMALSSNERALMGKKGREHMEHVFDKKKVVEMTLKGLGIS
ncbi:MAG: glycosyltransferase family 4 protein [Clostridia bacterium]|nr:glycosyltransferase family 4 protein [Clostridia bacterium]